jgi:hypothetical protein
LPDDDRGCLVVQPVEDLEGSGPQAAELGGPELSPTVVVPGWS